MSAGFYLNPLGEFYSAKTIIQNGNLEVKPLKKRSFLSTPEQLSLYSRGVDVAINSRYFTNEPEAIESYHSQPCGKGFCLFENTDKEWLYSVIGTNVKTIVPDYQAIANLYIKQSNMDSLLIYEENSTIKTVLIIEQKVLAVHSFQCSEISIVGLQPILNRLTQFYKQKNITENTPQEIVLLGSMTTAVSSKQNHLWDTVDIQYIKAAGSALPCLKSERIHTHKKRNVLRYFRRSILAASILLLLITAVMTVYLQSELDTFQGSDNMTKLLSSVEKDKINLLEKRATTLQQQIYRNSQYHHWEHLLALLGTTSKAEKVTIARMGSRKNKDKGVEILLRGSAREEKNINSFIKKLEGNVLFKNVTLHQLDKQDKRYEFSLQCLTSL